MHKHVIEVSIMLKSHRSMWDWINLTEDYTEDRGY